MSRSRGGTRIFTALLEAAFPGRCLLCGEWLYFEGGSPVCTGCLEGLTVVSGPRCRVCGMPLVSEKETCLRCRDAEFAFDACLPLFAFEGKIRDLIHLYKFSGRTRLSGVFADILAREASERMSPAVLVPVPPRPGRKGHDHIGAIARQLRSRHGIEVCMSLERGKGPAQKSLDFEERRMNLVGAFRIRPGARVPRNALLLDDVFTTGATLDACAQALRDGGAERVSAVTIAIDM
jgi:ComF family protein